MAVWMGLTMGCAQCHSHKYDPITQEEYFRFYALFNQTEDADKSDDSPLLTLLTPAQEKQKAKAESDLAAAEKKLLMASKPATAPRIAPARAPI